MALDYVIDLACAPKRQLGNDDTLAGTERLLDMLKAATRAAVLTEMAERDGRDPLTIEITLAMRTADGLQERQVSMAELRQEAAGLAVCEGHCAGCPANFQKRPVAGCIGVIGYPITPMQEEWLMAQLQPAGSPGARLLVAFMRDHNYTGAPVAEMRRRPDLFASKTAVERVIEKSLFRRVRLSSDQLLQSIMSVGSPLGVGHCFGILAWLGIILLDGAVPRTPDGLQTLLRLSAAERRARTGFALARGNWPGEAAQFVGLLDAMYRAWREDVPLLVSA